MKPKVAVVGGDDKGIAFGVELGQNGHPVLYIDLSRDREKRQEHSTIDVTNELCNLQNIPFIFLFVPESQVFNISKQISPFLSPRSCLIIKQPVSVGTGDRLQEWYDQKGKDIEVIVSPVFTEPSAIVLGGDSSRSGIHKLRRFISNQVFPVIITNRKNAEMIKLAASAFQAMKMSFINEFSRFSEVLGTDIDTISKVIGLDPKVGQAYLKAGIGFDEPSLLNELQLLKLQEIKTPLLDAVHEVNEEQKQWVIKTLHRVVPIPLNDKKIAVWGSKGTIACGILQELRQQNVNLSIYEPADQSNPLFHGLKTLEDSVQDADGLLILEEQEEFLEANLAMIKEKMKCPLIIDGRNLFPPLMMEDWGFKYVSVGRKI